MDEFLAKTQLHKDESKNMIKLPEIGQTITPDYAERLCEHFKIYYLANRIQANMENLKPFVFDGCSGIDDEQMARWKVLNLPWDKILICCLRHDLKYAFGKKHTWKERLVADLEFQVDLLEAGVPKTVASVFFRAVRALGGQELNIKWISWGFAWE